MQPITITASIKAKTVRLSGGKTRTIPARTQTVGRDESGRWVKVLDALEQAAFGATVVAITEVEVIDILSKSSEWPAIRSQHFAMHGFHS